MKNGSVSGGVSPYLDWDALMFATGSGTVAVNTYREMELVAGDYIEVGAWQDSGSSINVVANRCMAGIRRIL